ncbi:MAG: DUF4129 domain-containing protein [Chloroflexi bacterium]|nr:DUF4129 domain-containing protein [Chloroflexota bacterium]
MTAAAPLPDAERPDGAAPTDIHADHAAAALLAVAGAGLLHLLSVLGRVFVPAWPASPLLPLVGAIVTLIAFYRHRWTRLFRPFGSRVPIYLAELILLLVLTRLASLALAPGELLARAPRWWMEPFSIFDLVFVIDALFVAGAWLLGHTAGSAVDQLHLQPGEAPPPRGTADYAQWERSQAAFDHRGAQRQLANLVIGGVAVVVVALALISLGPPAPGVLTEALIAAGLTLASGLLLLGWAQVTVLDTLWRLEGLVAPPLLRGRWAGWLLTVVVVVAVLALLLPRTYAVDPLALLFWLLAVLTGLFQLLLFMIMLPFIWLASLLGISSSGGGGVTPPPVLPAAERADTDWSLLETLKSFGFWLATAALTVYAVRTLYQSRWGLMRFLPRIALWSWLGQWWQALLGGLRERAGTLAALIRASAGGRGLVAALRRPSRPPRPTDPRGLVQFLYLSLIERAGRRGLPRRRGMTAAEYSRFLATRLSADSPPGAATTDGSQPTAVAALDTLTAAFLEARYSRHPVGEGEVGRARRALQRLLALIRQRQARARLPDRQ